jgi:hypothetical protein
VALTGSAVSKNDLKTIMWYRLAKKAVNERADIKESIRALLLKSLEASGASGASGPASPWHAVLSKGTFTLDVFIHERKSSTAGLVMYQLALVPTAESMTPELAEAMTTVKTNMTAGSGSQARYFTMRERGSSAGISLAVLAAAPAAKRKASEAGEDVEGLVKKVARAEAGPYYLEDEDYGARYATAGGRRAGREATVAEVP